MGKYSSLCESQQDFCYLSLVYTNSPLSSAAEPLGYEIMPLCFLISQRLYFHEIADIVSDLSFYALNEWKSKKEKKNNDRKKIKEGQKREKKSRYYFHDLKYFMILTLLRFFASILKPLLDIQ